MTALLEYLDLTALLEYIDLLNRYSGGSSWGLLGPFSGWGPGQNAPVAPPPPPPVGGPAIDVYAGADPGGSKGSMEPPIWKSLNII